uniref:Uncharacterized protein n=1 Tax=Arundo donax TaxID=35708 RepID=A0A0A9EXH4_ARUDO
MIMDADKQTRRCIDDRPTTINVIIAESKTSDQCQRLKIHWRYKTNWYRTSVQVIPSADVTIQVRWHWKSRFVRRSMNTSG